MRAEDLRELLKARPFETVQLSLSDGRSVIIRHPEQSLLTERKLFLGLVKVQRSKPLMTPATGDPVTNEWMLVDLLHIIGAEPVNGTNGHRPRRRRRS